MNNIEEQGKMTTMGTFGLAATINSLREQGYTKDYNLNPERINEDYVIDHVYRFDVWTDPADQSVLYAIRRKETGEKGIIVNGYGLSSDPDTNSTLQSVERWEDEKHDHV